MPEPQEIHLRLKQGSSDKEYHASLEPDGEAWVVTTSWGRYKATLSTKTYGPMPYAAAKRKYDDVAQEKTGKGYSPMQEGGVPFAATEKDGRQSGILPQLLNHFGSRAELEAALSDPAWWGQEKKDGHRRLVKKQGEVVVGINRNGLVVPLPEPVAAAVAGLPGDFVVDGELVGSDFYPFDLIVPGIPYAERLSRLEDLWTGLPNLVETARTELAKRELLADVTRRNGEGIVLKRHDAPYTEGKPNSGGPQMKWKLTATASCIVLAHKQDKASIQLGVHDGGQVRAVGFTKVHANQTMPAIGSVVEVEYLFAYPEGSLREPNLLGVRDDIAPEACTVKQLKMKAGDEEDPEPEVA